MITELKQVISKVEQLGEQEQKEIAKLLEEEMNWESALQNSQNDLSNLAKEAVTEYNSGRTKREDW